jgi:phosphate transport system protein
MTRTRFQQALEELKEKLLAMGGMAEAAVDRAIRAYRERDRRLCQQVFEGEAAINAAEREIDELALDLLAMQQPMAVDLRFILAVIKINADLERVGDQAVNIAERVMELASLPQAELPADIPLMAATAADMVRRALESFITADAGLAQQVLKMDDVVDGMNREISDALTAVMESQPDVARQALDVIIVARNLERVGDHATNIAEDVIFWTSGADVRHHSGAGPAS